MQHAAKEGTALTVADRQMESYRSLPFSCIPSTLSGTAPTGCPSFSGFPNPYSASQSVSGSAAPDHRAYTVTTTLAVSGSQKQITVSVSGQTSGTTLARQSSYFSASGSS